MDHWTLSSYKLCSAYLFLVTLDHLYIGVESGSSQDEVNSHLVLGGNMLAAGQLQDALSHFHAAVDGDPNNYLTYFKRATVYLALRKANLALADFNKVLDLKPDFLAAKNQRALILMKLGKLQEAREDFAYLYHYDGNEEAYNNLILCDALYEDIRMSESYIQSGNYAAAVDELSQIIESVPWSSHLRELRSQCYVALNDPLAAVLDLRSTTKLQVDNTDGFFKLAILLYQLGQPHESLKEVRECLKLDPEHKDCFPHYKKVKKVVAHYDAAQSALDTQDYEACANAANKLVKVEDKIHMIKFMGKEKLCQCLLHLDKPTESLVACSEALEISQTADLLCDRAEAYINNDMYDEAMRDYRAALDLHDGYHRAKEGLQRAQRMQRQSEKRDYYKILNVKRTANKQEITKAYRKAAQKWHPDNFPDGEQKKLAEKKFIDIAAAKEVLTDPEKRRKFDQGEDPLDPESGQHQGFNPFQHFHQFHSGGPFTLKFHYN